MKVKQNWLVGGVSFALALAVVSFTMLRPVASAPGDDVKAVNEVLQQNSAALEKGDLAALGKLWAHDETVTVFENGHANYGWTDYHNNHLAPEMKEMKNVKFALSDVRVKVSGAMAWATFKYAIAADLAARHVDGNGLGTAVLEKRNGPWLIVHWHTSAPRRPATPAPTPAKKP